MVRQHTEYVQRTKTIAIVHGKYVTYHAGCRCHLCTAAQKEKTRAYRARRRQARREAEQWAAILIRANQAEGNSPPLTCSTQMFERELDLLLKRLEAS